MTDVKTIKIDDVEYVRKSNVEAAKPKNGMKYVIVRAYSAGVFAGYLESREGKEVTMRDVRRIWYWDGAASLSQMAMEGVSKPKNCKFSMPVDRQVVLEAIEILDCSEAARQNLEGVAIWKA